MLRGLRGGMRWMLMDKLLLSDDLGALGRGRSTSQYDAVLGVLGSSDRFRTAQDIYAELRSRGERIGLTTVYRHLQKLADEGVIHSLQTADRQTAYRLCSALPHHHLVCTRCGASIEIDGDEVDRWAQQEARRRGFSHVTHTLEIFGKCPSCSEKGE